jgi:hypothetical protein
MNFSWIVGNFVEATKHPKIVRWKKFMASSR